MKEIIEKAELIREEMKQFLLNHLDDFELYNVYTHYVEYTLKVESDNYVVKIWTANEQNCAKFYDGFAGVTLDYGEYTDDEKRRLWDKAQEDKTQTGEKRNITKTQMRNDLYFSFAGVFGQVKFTGYDDNDWWTKYKPEVVKETDEITWKIDLDNMVATYKRNN